MISVVLIEPEHPGNLGAVARAMANFGIKELLLVKPKCKKSDQEAKNRAKNAQSILKNVKTVTWPQLKKFNSLIATTAKIGKDYNIPRSPISPEQLNKILPAKGKHAIIFGRESSGLTNEEIQKCDFTITIPTPSKYAALNLSHAVTIMLYELTKKKAGKELDKFTPISSKEKEQLTKNLEAALKKMPFQSELKRDTQRKVWKKMVAKSYLTKREAFALLGFLKKI